MQNEPGTPEKGNEVFKDSLSRKLKPNPEEQIKALRGRVALFKEQAALLLKRFERRELSQREVAAEAGRLSREIEETEHQVKQWEDRRRTES